MPSLHPGCYTFHPDSPNPLFKPQVTPPVDVDISIDPSSNLLTVINNSPDLYRAFYLTIGPSHEVLSLDTEIPLERSSADEVTLIAVLPPLHLLDLCFLDERTPLSSLELTSNISDLSSYPSLPSLEPSSLPSFPFPLATSPVHPSFLCSQSFNGELSHFYPETLFAVDFDCPIGTPVLSIGEGTIKAIQQNETVTGISTNNLFKWNSIMIQLDSGYYVEYVHIKANSAFVHIGDRVSTGQPICLSGDVGFCPTPHLHIQVHESAASTALTVPFAFTSPLGPYIPIQGQNYP